MKTHLAWILGGGVVLALSGMSVGACSSGDDTNTNDSGVKDSTVPDTGKGDSGGPGDTGPGNDASDAGMGADCKTPSGPFTTDAGPFCPFQVGADGGSVFSDCANGQHCCIFPQASGLPSSCNAGNVSCSIGTDAGTDDLTCEESNDCTSGVCCLNPPGEIQQDPGCTSYYFIGKITAGGGTTCASSCNGTAQICGSSADCTGGKTCAPVNTKGVWLGVCVSADGGI